VPVIDGIDKADPDPPNASLDPLGNRGFRMPYLGQRGIRGATPPPVVTTTNEAREPPSAFLRRCLVRTLRPADPGPWPWWSGFCRRSTNQTAQHLVSGGASRHTPLLGDRDSGRRARGLVLSLTLFHGISQNNPRPLCRMLPPLSPMLATPDYPCVEG
jgi:hypothetical protein